MTQAQWKAYYRYLRISTREGSLLLRGDRLLPEVSVAQGMRPKGWSTDLFPYAENNHPSIYVGTTRDLATAIAYAEPGGYVYVIRARGGIDVNATLGRRSPHPSELEMVFPGGIPTERIVGAMRVGQNANLVGKFLFNPRYVDVPPPPFP